MIVVVASCCSCKPVTREEAVHMCAFFGYDFVNRDGISKTLHSLSPALENLQGVLIEVILEVD